MRWQMPYHVCLRASRREQLIRAPVTAGTFQTRIKIDYRFPSAIQTPPEGKHINEHLMNGCRMITPSSARLLAEPEPKHNGINFQAEICRSRYDHRDELEVYPDLLMRIVEYRLTPMLRNEKIARDSTYHVYKGPQSFEDCNLSSSSGGGGISIYKNTEQREEKKGKKRVQTYPIGALSLQRMQEKSHEDDTFQSSKREIVTYNDGKCPKSWHPVKPFVVNNNL
ncbi:hypothetical protein J6590_099637 [Homalodisca vitripennis]|nr:hypothetical protein J6590_099637 [Homalodisca vitripennis]